MCGQTVLRHGKKSPCDWTVNRKDVHVQKSLHRENVDAIIHAVFDQCAWVCWWHTIAANGVSSHSRISLRNSELSQNLRQMKHWAQQARETLQAWFWRNPLTLKSVSCQSKESIYRMYFGNNIYSCPAKKLPKKEPLLLDWALSVR